MAHFKIEMILIFGHCCLKGEVRSSFLIGRKTAVSKAKMRTFVLKINCNLFNRNKYIVYHFKKTSIKFAFLGLLQQQQALFRIFWRSFISHFLAKLYFALWRNCISHFWRNYISHLAKRFFACLAKHFICHLMQIILCRNFVRIFEFCD